MINHIRKHNRKVSFVYPVPPEASFSTFTSSDIAVSLYLSWDQLVRFIKIPVAMRRFSTSYLLKLHSPFVRLFPFCVSTGKPRRLQTIKTLSASGTCFQSFCLCHRIGKQSKTLSLSFLKLPMKLLLFFLSLPAESSL